MQTSAVRWHCDMMDVPTPKWRHRIRMALATVQDRVVSPTHTRIRMCIVEDFVADGADGVATLVNRWLKSSVTDADCMDTSRDSVYTIGTEVVKLEVQLRTRRSLQPHLRRCNGYTE